MKNFKILSLLIVFLGNFIGTIHAVEPALAVTNSTNRTLKITIKDTKGEETTIPQLKSQETSFFLKPAIKDIGSFTADTTELKTCRLPGGTLEMPFAGQTTYNRIEIKEDKGKLFLECNLNPQEIFVG